ncbi:Myotubularin-related protein 2 [Tieghemostelium lacteum]|uniref:Myotubularin-related protein 2 n=1 Tax=Tieghemostelium lacteum TaxID=361077 RepID=A0A151ZDK6_TIELA|nr:Myotubularin-related protein 2 [Tieghemostelium lacteum]|eukprot:KYQ92021.1 Myotubularin-related protein 2 [Tieghemostelium lacteum]
MTDTITIVKNSLFGVSLNKLSSKYKIKDIPIILELPLKYLQSRYTEVIENNNNSNSNKYNDINQLFNQCRETFKFELSVNGNKEKIETLIQRFAKSNEFSSLSEQQFQSSYQDFYKEALPNELVFQLVNLYLEKLTQPLFQDVASDVLACNSKVQPLILAVHNLSPQEFKIVERIIKTLYLVTKSFQVLSTKFNQKDTGNKNINDHQFVKIITDRYYEVFFGQNQNQLLKKSLGVLVSEYPVIFQETPVDFQQSLISGEEIQFGPIHFVKLQIIEFQEEQSAMTIGGGSSSQTSSTSQQQQQSSSNINPKLRCITLCVSNFRLIYQALIKETQDYVESYGLALSSIQFIKKTSKFIKITTKHSKVIHIGFSHKSDESLFLSVIDKLSFHKPVKSIFSFQNTEDSTSSVVSPSSSSSKSSKSNNNSNKISKIETYWNLLSLEFSRFGISNQTTPGTSTNSKDKFSNAVLTSTSPYWRISLCNTKLDVCQSYPNNFLIPKQISDSQMKEFAHFRVGKRFPMLSWINPNKANVFLSISHPPRIDYLTVTSSVFGSDDEDEDEDEIRNKNVYDYTLVDEYYKISNQHLSKDQTPNKLLIFDTGPVPKNPYDSFYKICQFHYLSLTNHDQNKQAYQKLIDLCSQPQSLEHGKWLQLVEATGWIEIIRSTLRNTLKVVESLIQGRSCMIQSGDGHDYDELILSSLSQVIMDPFYRTIKGFQRLVQKEWCEFGYPFGRQFTTQDRNNLPCSFMIFMDCCYQLICQYPMDFEFNEKMIRFISEEVYNGRFGNFISKTLKDQESMSIQNNTISIWLYMNQRKPTTYLNNDYRDYSKSNLPIKLLNLEQVVFWSDFFSRWITIDSRIHAQKTINLQLQVQNEVNLSNVKLFDLPIRLFKSHSQKYDQITKIQLLGNNLQLVPKSILQFHNLRELILDNNMISNISSSFYQLIFESLKKIEFISLAQNILPCVPSDISLGGHCLRKLNFQSNRIVTISPHIVKLIGLVSLNVSNNILSIFPMEFTQLESLKTLDISQNQITNIPFQLSQLHQLTHLNMSDNRITRLPNSISDLKQLKYLNLNTNKIKQIESICQIGSSLEELMIDFNKISEIPIQIGRLEGLQHLSVQNNRIESLPDELMLLGNLKTLKLGQNQISWLPPTICQLEKLESLLIQNNQIDALPQTIGMLSNLTILDIEGNKLNKKLAKEIGVGGIKEILTQMKEFIEKIQPYGKSKIIILGLNNLKSNKTLTNTLFHKEKKNQKSTSQNFEKVSGVDIENIVIDQQTGKELNCWEFNNTHNQYQSMFFTEKSVYLVQFIFNPSEDANSTLDYWLDLICHRYNSNIKLFAVGFISQEVGNQLNDKSFQNWIQSWKSTNRLSIFINRQIEFIFVNQSSLESDLESLKEKVIESLPKKTMANEMIPSPFSLLEQHLIEKRSPSMTTTLSPGGASGGSNSISASLMGINFMQKDEIIELAGVFNIRGLAKIGNVLKYLENTSTILQFPQDNQYSNLIITNPTWLYSILMNASQKSQAVIRKQDLLGTIPNTSQLVNLLNRYNIISHIEPLGSMPIPNSIDQIRQKPCENVLVNQFFDQQNPMDFLDQFIQHQHKDDLFLERYFQFQYSIPNHLYQEFKFRLYQIAKLEFENTLEKKSLFISYQDHLLSESTDSTTTTTNNTNNQHIRLYLHQVDCKNLKIILFGSNKKMPIAHDLYGKIQDILQLIIKSKYSFNSFQVLVPCVHPNEKHLKLTNQHMESRHFYRVELLELSFLMGNSTIKCSKQSQLNIQISDMAPDVTMSHFPSKLLESDVQFGKELGRGGFGIVYRGKLLKDNKEVAIKKLMIENSRYLDQTNGQSVDASTLNPEDEMDLIRAYRDFQREAYSLHKYQNTPNSKNILKIYGIVLKPPCLLTEFVPKGDLDSYIKTKGPLPLKHAVRIALDIAYGISELHQQSPPQHHNDLKPPNILLNQWPVIEGPSTPSPSTTNSASGNAPIVNIGHFNEKQPVAVVADLGTVYDSISSRLLGRIVDNPIYLAPEILKGQWYDSRSDVYSFGVILYEMVSKQGGYFSEITFFGGIEDMVLKGKRPPLPQISVDSNNDQNMITNYLTLLQQCWNQDPNQRPTFQKIINILSQISSVQTSQITNPGFNSIGRNNTTFQTSRSTLNSSNNSINSGNSTPQWGASPNSSPVLNSSNSKISPKPLLGEARTSPIKK